MLPPSRWSVATGLEYLLVLWGTLKYVKAGRKGLDSSCVICFNHLDANYITHGYRERSFNNAMQEKPRRDRKAMPSITCATPVSEGVGKGL